MRNWRYRKRLVGAQRHAFFRFSFYHFAENLRLWFQQTLFQEFREGGVLGFQVCRPFHTFRGTAHDLPSGFFFARRRHMATNLRKALVLAVLRGVLACVRAASCSARFAQNNPPGQLIPSPTRHSPLGRRGRPSQACNSHKSRPKGTGWWWRGRCGRRMVWRGRTRCVLGACQPPTLNRAPVLPENMSHFPQTWRIAQRRCEYENCEIASKS